MMTSCSDKAEKLADLNFRIAWLEDAVEESKRVSEQMRNNLGERFKSRTFDSFDTSLQRDAFEVCKDYAERFSEIKSQNRNSLLLVGSFGTGKTHLASAIANHLIDKGVVVKFGTWGSILDQIRDGFDDRVIRGLKTVKLLIIDDYGKDKSTEWNDAILFEVINSRYEANLPTVITTNLSGRDLMERVGQAVYSRMSETFRGVKMDGEDFRKRGTNGQKHNQERSE